MYNYYNLNRTIGYEDYSDSTSSDLSSTTEELIDDLFFIPTFTGQYSKVSSVSNRQSTINVEPYFRLFNKTMSDLNSNFNEVIRIYGKLQSGGNSFVPLPEINKVELDNWEVELTPELIEILKGYNDIVQRYSDMFVKFATGHNEEIRELTEMFKKLNDEYKRLIKEVELKR